MNEMASESPYDLLISSSHGNIDAYGELFDRYGQKLYNFAYYLTYSREEAQDITSDTFIRVFEALQGREVSSFNLQAYLYKTARNLSLKTIERRKREGLTLEEASEFAEGDIFADPERAALLSEQREKVKDASGELTDDQQVALLLKELEGLPYDTIAEVLDSNPNAVGALLSRARLKFREVYRMAHAQTKEIPDECARITPMLSAYIDNEATPEEGERISEHLATCPICNENLNSMSEASITYRSLIPLLPLATFKVWSMAKAAIAGKAVIAGAAAAGSVAGGGVGAGGAAAGSAAGAGAVSIMTSSFAVKIIAIVAAAFIAAGAGTGIYFGVHKPAPKYYSVAFERDGDIWTAQLDEKYNLVPETEVDITLSPESEGEPRWSPDGKKILYIMSSDQYISPSKGEGFIDYDEVCSIDNMGGKPTLLVSKARSEPIASSDVITYYDKYSSPMWDPVTSKILYAAQGIPSASYGIDVFDYITKKTSRIQVSLSTSFDVSSNQEIVCASEFHGSGSSGFKIIGIDGSIKVNKITSTDSDGCGCPAWKPDGESFSAGFRYTTKIINRKGDVIAEKAIADPMTWLNDSVGLTEKDGNVTVVDFNTGTEHSVIPNASEPCGIISDKASVEQSKNTYSSDEQQIVRLFGKWLAEFNKKTSEFKASFGGLKMSNDRNWADVLIPTSEGLQGGQIIYKKENGKWVEEAEGGEMQPQDYQQYPPEILRW